MITILYCLADQRCSDFKGRESRGSVKEEKSKMRRLSFGSLVGKRWAGGKEVRKLGASNGSVIDGYQWLGSAWCW